MLACREVTREYARLLLKHDVDHTGDGIGAILCRGAVAQDFDAFDGIGRDGIEVSTHRTAVHGTVDVYQGRLVAALAVHQHEYLVRTQTAQLCRIYVVGPIGDCLAGRLEGRRYKGEDLVEIDLAYVVNHLSERDDVNRYRGFELGAGLVARANDDHVIELNPFLELDINGCLVAEHHFF